MNYIKYSDTELKLIKYFGYLDIKNSIEPIVMYRLMAEKAFLDNDNSEYSFAVREGLKALRNCSPYRLTDEFDTLLNNQLMNKKGFAECCF